MKKSLEVLRNYLKDEEKKVGKKVLIVCGQEIVKERNDGGKLCSYRNFQLFQQTFGKENVYLIMFSKYRDIDENANIIRLPYHKNSVNKVLNIIQGHMFTSASVENKVLDFVEKQGIEFVVFERSMFGSLVSKLKKKSNCKIGVFIHNIEKQYFKNKLLHRGAAYLLPYLCVKHSESTMLKNTDYIMTLTKRDSRLLKEVYGVSGDIVLPMSFQDSYDDTRDIQKNDGRNLLFIGTMFPPNYDGVKWFVEYVMPELKEYTLQIVGKNFEQKRKELERDNVQVIGTVDDLSEYYYSDSAMVMPIFYGDGMKIKTAESIMYGRIIFAADEALEGYEADGVDGIYRCNTKEEFIESIRNYFDNKKEVCFSKDVRALFIRQYSFEKQVEYCKKK